MEQQEMPITAIDLDMTNDCVLRCDYCFRGQKENRYLTYEVGTRALDWLIENSGNAKSLSVALFGGEPLMHFKMIKRLVPYGKRKAAYHGKKMHFGATTNSVLVNDEIIEYFRQHGMTFHTSIDGGRISHDKHRHFPNGKGSWDIIVPKIKKILSFWPNTTARATITNDNIERWLQDTLDLVALGYKNLAMIPVPECEWTQDQWNIMARELRKISDYYIERYRQGNPVYIKHIEDAIGSIVKPRRRRHHCGAGRGNIAVKTDGTLYPCHRFGGELASPEWCLGSIFEGGLDQKKRSILLNFDCHTQLKAERECESCLAVHMCGTCCIAVNYAMFGDIYKNPESHCRMYEMFYREGLRVHYILQSEKNQEFVNKFYGDPDKRRNNRRSPRTRGPGEKQDRPDEEKTEVPLAPDVPSTESLEKVC